ncbi:DUF881 domain-containing protein [bacterium]|nr:DUF881 domain-containing protein [bacterium]
MDNIDSSSASINEPTAAASGSSSVPLPPGVIMSAVPVAAPSEADETVSASQSQNSPGDAAGQSAAPVVPAPDAAALVAPIATALVDAIQTAASAASAATAANAANASGAVNAVNAANAANSASLPNAAAMGNVSAGAAPSPERSAAGEKVSAAREAAMPVAKHNYIWNYTHSWQFPVALACILLGIMVGLQYRSQVGKGDLQIDDRRKLVELVRAMESERNKMSNELKETRAHMVELEEASGKREQVSKQLQDQLVRSRIEAGLTGMKGPGVVVSLNDSPRTAPATEDNYFYIVHDVDLTALVNELWAAGAEAISVNEQRIVTRSSIRCVGPAVLVNGVRLTAPYVVKAIGSKDLETALRMPGGFLNSMAPLISKGGEVKMNSLQEVVIPPYEGSSSFRYGQSFEKSAEASSDEKDGKS